MNIFITTCSMTKAGGGKDYSAYHWKNEGRNELLKMRRRILEMMEIKRIMSSMKLPVYGPDFGGNLKGGQYLPALKRYSHGAFMGGLKVSKTRLTSWGEINRLYFISGLYGIAHYKEPIQNYDLDIYQSEVLEVWRGTETLTKILLRDLKWKREEHHYVFDCCADEIYQSLIDWSALSSEGLVIRHAMSNGQYTGRQVRWTCGHLAGAAPDRLVELAKYETSQYTSENGSIRFLKNFPMSRPRPKPREIATESQGIQLLNNVVKVACLRPEQFDSFMTYARKHGWEKHVKFERIQDLSKATIERLDKSGIRLLIAHVDDTHEEIRKKYKIRSFDFPEDLPSDWQYRKVANNSYSDMQFKFKLIFKS